MPHAFNKNEHPFFINVNILVKLMWFLVVHHSDKILYETTKRRWRFHHQGGWNFFLLEDKFFQHYKWISSKFWKLPKL
jgi:hypothetical protein